MSRLLNDQENSAVSSALGDSAVHFATIARVFKAEDSTWRQDVTGAVVVLTQDGAHYIKVVDLGTKSVVFSQELYQNFEYAKPRGFFHTFEMDDCVAGLSFADEGDANDFYLKVIECKKGVPSSSSSSSSLPPLPNKPSPPPPLPNKPAAPPPPRVSAPPPPVRKEPEPEPEPEPFVEEYYQEEEPVESPTSPRKDLPPPPAIPETKPAGPPTPQPPTTTTSTPAKGTLKKKKGLFGKLKSGLLGGDDDEEVLMISEPSNFRHVSNIGWNPKEGSFEINNIPPEWKKLFQGIGIKKSDLKNKETAGMIAQIIEDSGVDVAAPPPPPPPGPPPPPTPSAPPPPSNGPPTTSSGGGGSRLDLSSALSSVSLKKVDPNEPRPDLPPQSGGGGLADTLAKAMSARRGAIKEEVEEAEDDWEDDDW